MSFMLAIGRWARPRVRIERGVYIRVVLGFVAVWLIWHDMEAFFAQSIRDREALKVLQGKV